MKLVIRRMKSLAALLSIVVSFTYIWTRFLAAKDEANANLSSFRTFVQSNTGRWRKYINPRRGIASSSQVGSGAIFYILDWTHFWGSTIEDEYLIEGCPSLSCRITDDRRLLRQSAAVIFHPPDIATWDWPLWRVPYQSYVMTLWESPSSFARKRWLDLHRYNGMFNLTMTYRYDSDIIAPYGYVEKRRENEMADSVFQNAIEKIMKKKSKLVTWFVSECSTPSRREDFVADLKKYVPVDIYGKCGTGKCAKNACNEHEILVKYKFYLALENSICKDYVTEKFYERLQHDLVPIVVAGAGNFQQDNDRRYPPNGYISVTNFSTTKELADYLLYLDAHPGEYAKYFQWKRKYEVVASWQRMMENAFCQLCQRLMWIEGNFNSRRKSYEDVYDWWFENPKCDDDLLVRFLE